tara:strand:- start:4474 stop:5604 length:1131 start_codon:yes stop_codon:yes gene_type:complete
MRLLIDASNLVPESGGFVHLKKTLENFTKKKFDKIVIVSSKEVIKKLNIKNPKILFETNLFLNKNLFYRIFWKVFILNFTAKKFKSDVIFILGGYFVIKPNIPTIILIQNLLPFSNISIADENVLTVVKNIILRVLHKYSIRRADLSVYLSRHTNNILKNLTDKYLIINHGVEKDFYYKRVKFHKFNSKNNHRKFKILYLSKYEKYKNHINLVRACQYLKNKGHNISLDLVGIKNNNFEKSKLFFLIKKINKKHKDLINVRKIETHRNIKKILKEYDLHVYPSTCESFGIIILETIASSLPIICSDYPVFKEILRKNTLYFNPYNFLDISKKILIYMNNNLLRKNNTMKLFRLSKNYNWDLTCEKTYLAIKKQLKT